MKWATEREDNDDDDALPSYAKAPMREVYEVFDFLDFHFSARREAEASRHLFLLALLDDLAGMVVVV